MTDIKQVLIVDLLDIDNAGGKNGGEKNSGGKNGGVKEIKSVKARLDSYLSEALAGEGWTRSQIKKQIDDNRVSVNGNFVKAGFLVKTGDAISLDLISAPDLSNIEPENIPLDIIYEDDDIAVINKPQGLVVHPAVSCPNHTLVNALVYHFKALSNGGEAFRPGIVHRIDKNTSGLLVVAKNNEAHIDLARQIAEHSCARTYVSLTEGEFKEMSGNIIAPIARDPRDYKKMTVADGGKYAETHFEVLALFDKFSLVRFNLKTGRTHQIRVHAKSINHPIVGDDVYAPKSDKFNLNGQLLHAIKLKLVHPKTKREMEFYAPVPDYFKNFLQKLHLKWQKNVDTLDEFV